MVDVSIAVTFRQGCFNVESPVGIERSQLACELLRERVVKFPVERNVLGGHAQIDVGDNAAVSEFDRTGEPEVARPRSAGDSQQVNVVALDQQAACEMFERIREV